MRQRLRRALPDLLIIAVLLAVPLAFFFPQTLGGRTLLPADNLFQWEPFKSLAGEYGVGAPHNALLSDLLIENAAWKGFIRQQVAEGQLPLWQPNILAGTPFLAAGQSSALYPFTALFLILPTWLAYGWFTVSQLWLAGVNMYLFTRVLGLRKPASLIAALAYQLSGFMMVSVVFPMIIATAAWLPFILAMAELAIREGRAFGSRPATASVASARSARHGGAGGARRGAVLQLIVLACMPRGGWLRGLLPCAASRRCGLASTASRRCW
jgi:hypothetical protein